MPDILPVAIAIFAVGCFVHHRVICSGFFEASLTPFMVSGCFPGDLQFSFPHVHCPSRIE